MTAMPALSPEDLRKGWCPGALRPMQTGDGLLVRLRLTNGIVPAPLARALAQAARHYGNGRFDLSARANLQMRGVSEATLEPLIAVLRGLAVLDAEPDAEAVRNVIAGPLAGIDPTARCDTRPVVAALERRLSEDTALHGLPGKFGFLVDGGGMLPLSDIAADIRFESVTSANATAFAVRAGGDAATARPVTLCEAADVPEVAARLARAFLQMRGVGPAAHRRMASLARAAGGHALAQAAGLSFVDMASPAVSAAAPVLGVHAVGPTGWLGVGAVFGRWTAEDLDVLADLAERHGTGELRLTPWRAILLPGVSEGAALATLSASERFVLDPADPRLSVIACAGAPACSSGLAPSRSLALALAGDARRLAKAGVTLHVSGCAKGCAWPQQAPVALVGRSSPGHPPSYDLVIGGKAGDAASRTGLTPEEAAAALRDLAETAARTGDLGVP